MFPWKCSMASRFSSVVPRERGRQRCSTLSPDSNGRNQAKWNSKARNFIATANRALARLRNEKMGFVFQGYFLLPELTALENVMLPGMIGRHRGKRSLRQSLEAVGLGDRLNHLPPELSGGEQQRVAIARALTNDPDIIFADEPTGNLDSKTGDAIMDLLLGLAQERNKTLVVVTHDNNLAQRGDRTLRIVDAACSTIQTSARLNSN